MLGDREHRVEDGLADIAIEETGNETRQVDNREEHGEGNQRIGNNKVRPTTTTALAGETEQEDDLLPVEGKRAWMVVLGSFLMHFVILGSMYTIGLYIVPWQEEFEAGRSDTSVPYTLAATFLFMGGLVSGRLADKYDIKRVYTVGVGFWILGTLCASFANSMIVVSICIGITGIGMGLTYWPAASVVPMWFEQRRALASGVAALGAGLGNFAFGLAVEETIDEYGWRQALRGSALIGGTILVVSIFLLKRRLPPQTRGGFCSDAGVLHQHNMQVLLVMSFLFQCSFHIPFVHLDPYIEDMNLDPGFGGLAVGLLGIGSAVGRLLLGVVSDRFGRIWCFQMTLFGTAVTMSIWPALDEKIGLGCFAFFYGLFSGGLIALMPVIVAEYYGVARLGGIMGYIAIALIPGSVAGPIAVGAIKDKYNSYTGAIIGCAVLLYASAFSLCFLTKPPSQEELKQEQEQQEPDEPE